MTASITNAIRKVSLVLAVAVAISAPSSSASFAFSSEGAADVHGRRFPPLQFGNP